MELEVGAEMLLHTHPKEVAGTGSKMSGNPTYQELGSRANYSTVKGLDVATFGPVGGALQSKLGKESVQ
jgi:hypothetical protein